MIDFLLDVINPIAWVTGNVLIAYDAIIILIFVIGYIIIYDPSTTTAGKLIFRFFVSLMGLIILVFIGTYIDPAADRIWLELPNDVDGWRPVFRTIVYGYIGYSVTSLAVLLVIRKWWPDKVNTAPDLVKPRHETNEIPIVKNS